MSKTKKTVVTLTLPSPQGTDNSYEIKSAAIKDGVCIYSYELLSGVSEGDLINRTGSNFIHDDMKEAFNKLKVHLAIIDDVFKYSKVEFETISEVEDHELTGLFEVSGFKLNSAGDAVNLIGYKTVSHGGAIDLKSPKISFESSYPFATSLEMAIDACKREVVLYMNGKYAPKMEQATIDFKEENEFVEEGL